MNVHCDDLLVFEETLDDPAPEGRLGLEQLLIEVRRGTHRLILAEPEGLLASPWFAQQVSARASMELRELLRRSDPALENRGLDPLPRRRGPRVELRPGGLPCSVRADREANPVWEMGAAALTDWLEGGLCLVVENQHDWALIAGPCRLYGRPALIRAVRMHALKVDHRGGSGEVLNRVRAASPKDRLFVLMDSDRLPESPEEEGATQQAVRAAAKGRPNIALFILKKREAENYLPKAAWELSTPSPKGMRPGRSKKRAEEHLKAFRRWDRLSDKEKDLIDLESCFPDAKDHVADLCNPDIIPDIATLESRAGDELLQLLDALEAWL